VQVQVLPLAQVQVLERVQVQVLPLAQVQALEQVQVLEEVRSQAQERQLELEHGM
jgi:hypothetical protein